MKSKLVSILENFEWHIMKVFEDLHRNPELSNEEFETTKKIKKYLEEVGIEVLNLNLKTGLVAIIRGEKEGKTIALRADIDALPIIEETDIEYKSEVIGKMHACGHDFHTATMIGVAYLLKEIESEVKGNIKIVFQHAEEAGNGAKDIIKTGVLDDVSAIFGFHNTSELEVGKMSAKEGPVTASVDRFKFILNGVGAHGATPEKSKDPIIAGVSIVNAIQTIMSRNIGCSDKVAISVTNISIGNTWNVIPQSGVIEGTVRTLSDDTRNFIEKRFNEIANGFATVYDMDIKLKWFRETNFTNNNTELVEFSRNLAIKKEFKDTRIEMGMVGEDFSEYQNFIKGMFLIFGTGISYPHHNPKYMVDKKAISDISKYFRDLSIGVLNELN